ncbi:MAG: NAD(P)H-dependent glycerol-3-phosphate dehydrogenase [Alphaproteobacteria bacterium]|jgi:glycerol-3-phosphate dehydrogenase (NAD(P)+)|nr:NAD(P)H-dependent glycerol-3-phosphate dehydrogenase [Alphaproteobacteria bacterium]
MNISILGAGRWGTLNAWYQSFIGNSALLLGRENSSSFQELIKTRKNEYLTLQNDVEFTTSLSDALKNDMILISIPCQKLRSLCKDIRGLDISLNNKTFILSMKGLENSTGKRLTEIVREELGNEPNIAIFTGPGHAQSITNKIPTCMVIDSDNEVVKNEIVENFSSSLIRIYKGTDLIGNEIGAATKNIIGIAAGMLDGLNLSELKGALMTRGSTEVSRIIEACGGNGNSAYGLSHLGDYEATLFSKYSNNRLFGEDFIKGIKMDKTAEGVETLKAILKISKEYDLETPICSSLYKVIFEKADYKKVLDELFSRPIKDEF